MKLHCQTSTKHGSWGPDFWELLPLVREASKHQVITKYTRTLVAGRNMWVLTITNPGNLSYNYKSFSAANSKNFLRMSLKRALRKAGIE
jgi:hypothetical protein